MTRLHVRYDRAHFPEDLVFQVTGDRTNFQGRYIMRHEWKGDAACDAAEGLPPKTRASAAARGAQNLADLTGWKLDDIRGRMAASADWASRDDSKWWERLWKQ